MKASVGIKQLSDRVVQALAQMVLLGTQKLLNLSPAAIVTATGLLILFEGWQDMKPTSPDRTAVEQQDE